MGCAAVRGAKSRRGADKKQSGLAHTRARRSNKHAGHATHPTRRTGPDIRTVSDLADDPSTEMSDMLQRARALHTKWIHEDAKGVVEGEELKHCQRSRCREISLVAFGFVLNKA